MRLISLIFLAVVSLTIPCFAQTEREAMDIAKREVLRRGAYVVSTGTVRSGLVEQALAPPADDSDKWHFTLIGEAKEPKFEAMKKMLRETKEPSLLAWVDVKDAAHSTMFYHERVWDLAGTQKDWLLPLKDAVDKYGLPLVLIQPCLSGKYGDPSTRVKSFHGVLKDAELAERIQEAVITYVRTIDKPVNTSGVSQTEIGVPPPFNVNPQNAPPAPEQKREERRQNYEFPDLKPPALTLDQVRGACPGATPEFLLEVIAGKETNLEKVQLQWMVSQLKQERAKPSIDIKPVPEDDGEIVPARPGAKERSSFSVPSISSPETAATKLIGVFLAGMLAMKLMAIQWGTLIGDIGGNRNERHDVGFKKGDIWYQSQNSEEYRPSSRPSTTHEPIESSGATSESTRTSWRPPNARKDEPSDSRSE